MNPYSFIVLISLATGLARAQENPCAGRGTSILVRSAQHSIWLCEAGVTRKKFSASLGERGMGKFRQGDRKTPLGTYSLGTPRPSHEFHLFIPVGYPTPEQAAAGFTGGQIGLHGPPQWKNSLTWLAPFVDWTQGCVAVATNAQIAQIARWVWELTPTFIRLE